MCSAAGGLGNMRFLAFQIYLPFSDALKYSLLAFAIALFLAALIILACKLHQYYSYKATTAVKAIKIHDVTANFRDINPFVKLRNKSDEGPKEDLKAFYKKLVSGSNAEKKMERNILIKSLSPSFLDVARKEQDSKIQLMQKEMEKLEVHLTPSPPSTESLDDVGSDSDYPQGPRGKLKFNLHYKERTKMLRLAIIEATDLPEYTRDPFVRIRVFFKADDPQSEVQSVLHECETRVVKNSRNPTFDENFSFPLKDYPLSNLSLKLEVKDFDKYSRHTLIGETKTVMKDLKVSESLEFNEELQEKTKDIIGEALISLKCLPTAQKIEVGILKFKTSSPNIKERDVYARIDVFTNHHKQKHQKSSLRAKSKVTVFNETFLFSLPDLGKSQCLILVSLYETLSSGKKLIGQTTVGNQKTKHKDNNHWDLMMQTLRQPVAAWHLLYI